MPGELEILGEITEVEVIAAGGSVRESARLRMAHGASRWRKLKGVATVRLPNGLTVVAEIHWYEAHGIGRKEVKIKRLLR